MNDNKQPQVTLIDYTGMGNPDPDFAINKLIYTKNTRLKFGNEGMKAVSQMSPFDKEKELKYMAGTIPSSWEFVNYTFEIKNVTRAFTHQLVRNRTGSYAQQTMRLLDVSGFTYRDDIKSQPSQAIYKGAMSGLNGIYENMLASGEKAEDARGLLPTNIHTNIIAQFNLRSLCDMAKSRTGRRTQGEYREVFEMMMEAVDGVHPWTNQFLFPDRDKMLGRLEHLLSWAGEEEMAESAKTEAFKIIDKLKKEK